MSGYSLSFIPPGFLLPSQVWFHVFCVFHAVCEEKSQSLYVKVVDGVANLVEVITTGLSLQCLMSARCSLKRVSRVRPVWPTQSWAHSGAMNDVCNVVRQTVELFRDVHLWLRAMPVTLVLVQMKWHFVWLHGVVPGALVAGWRSLDVTDVGVAFVLRSMVAD